MSDFKAVETVYKGYLFRSRLEARWAIFFDSLGIKWEYEPEGIVLRNGKCYLPDFYLINFNCYFEVKRKGLKERVHYLCNRSNGFFIVQAIENKK